MMRGYIGKMRGSGASPPRVGIPEVLWSWAGAFCGIATISLIHYELLAEGDLLLLIGSFGASAVLIYGATKSPLAQPRNLMGGHVVSALVGVMSYQLLGAHMWLAASFAVATAIAIMHLSKTLHPPGGATALIAVIGGDGIHSLGYLYALIPVGTGALIMLVIALLVNNLSGRRQYPEYWL